MPAGDRIERFAVKIGHLDRVPGVAQRLERRVLQPAVNDVGSG
jgi:hypothetical protein